MGLPVEESACDLHTSCTIISSVIVRGSALLQVNRPGAIDPSAVDTTEDQAIIGQARKKVWIGTVIGYFALFILWPCLMAPAGGTWSIGYFR